MAELVQDQPQIFKTYDDALAELQRPRSYYQGNQTQAGGTPTTGGPQATGTPSGGGQTTAPTPPTVGPQTDRTPVSIASQQTYTPLGIDRGALGKYASIFEPVSTQYETASKGLQGLESSFMTGAGPSRTFENSGAQGTLDKALSAPANPTEGQANTEAARGLVKANYAGPTQLGELQGVTQLQDIASNIKSSDYLRTLFGEQRPGMTPGETRYSVGEAFKDPAFQQDVNYLAQRTGEIAPAYQREQQEAGDIATQRAAEEASIAKQSQDYLSGRGSGVESDIAAEVAKRNSGNQSITDAYQNFLQTGNINDLNAIPEASRVGFKPEDFNTPDRQRAIQAMQAATDIWKKYADIQDVPVLQNSISKRGREAETWDPEFSKSLQEKLGPEGYQKALAEAQARQADLVKAGFSPQDVSKNKAVDPTGAGQYSDILPLYYGDQMGAWMPADARSYFQEPGFGLNSGVMAARENTATTDQQRVINTINDLLGNQIQEWAKTDPFKAATVAANVKRYLDEEQATLASRKGQLSQADQEWADAIHAARKQYKKLHNESAFAKISDVIGATPLAKSTGLGPVLNIQTSFGKSAK